MVKQALTLPEAQRAGQELSAGLNTYKDHHLVPHKSSPCLLLRFSEKRKHQALIYMLLYILQRIYLIRMT